MTLVLGQLGVFPEDTLTEAHAHKLAVLNLNIRGSKIWRMAPPGHLRIDFKENICFQETQNPGEWIYIPPGWSHEVRTVGVEQVQDSELACSWSVMIARPPVHLLDSIMKADMAIVEKLKVRSGRTGELTAAMRSLNPGYQASSTLTRPAFDPLYGQTASTTSQHCTQLTMR